MPNLEVPRRSLRTRTLIPVLALVSVALVVAVVAARIHLVSGSGSSSAGGGFPSPTPSSPGAPTAFAAVARNGGQVELTWSAPAGDGITGFTIYRDGSLLKFVSPILSTYVDITVQPEHTYHYEIESVGPAGRSLRASIAGVRTPAPPPLALAQVNGFYALFAKVVSLNFINWERGQKWITFWEVLPVCSSQTACDLATSGDGERKATLHRSGRSYSGKILLPRYADCAPARTDAIDTVRFKVTQGRFIKGVWTASRLRGTIRREVPPSHGCLYGYALMEFSAMWDSPAFEAP